jgi:ribonucleotide monophosphatase NagD (HAD superfamily)
LDNKEYEGFVMSGGKSGYKGYTYQTLAFTHIMLNQDSVSGELEAGDDFLIIKEQETICYQTKDLSGVVGVSDAKKYVVNFLKYYNQNNKSSFIVLTNHGVSKNIDYSAIIDKLFKEKKIKKELYQHKAKVVSLISHKIQTRNEILANLKIKLSDVIKSFGGTVLSKETEVIIDYLIGKLFIEQRVYSKNEIVEVIEREGSRFIQGISKSMLEGATDLVIKYYKQGFSNSHADEQVHSVTSFLAKKRSLTLKPTLFEKIIQFYTALERSVKDSKVKELTLIQFKKIVDNAIKNIKDIEVQNYFDSDTELSEQIFNEMIRKCMFYPKK